MYFVGFDNNSFSSKKKKIYPSNEPKKTKARTKHKSIERKIKK